MKNRLITENESEKRHVIRPEHVSTSVTLAHAFENFEVETVARWVLQFCQKEGGWYSFTKADVVPPPRDNEERQLGLHLLEGFVVQGEDRRYRVTHAFVCRCFGFSPKEGVLD